MVGFLRALISILATMAIAACGPSPRQVSDSGFGAYEVSLAAWSDGLAVAWYDTRHGNAEIYVRFIDASGEDAGEELRVTTTPEQSYEADIVALDDAFAIAWYEKAPDESLRAWLGLWSRDGKPVWSRPIAVGDGNTRNPVVRVHDGALFYAWIEADAVEAEAVFAGWFELDGRPRGAPARLGPAGSTTWNLNAAVAESGTAYVAFDVLAGTRSEELFVATLADGRADLVQISADDGLPSKYPDLALRHGQVGLTWFDERDGNREVYLAVGSLEQLGTLAAIAHRVTDTPGQSIGAYLAWSGERLGLAWSDNTAGNYDVFFQPFNADGKPASASTQLSRTPTQSMIPAIRPWRNGFALAWDEVTRLADSVHDDATRAEVVFTTVP